MSSSSSLVHRENKSMEKQTVSSYCYKIDPLYGTSFQKYRNLFEYSLTKPTSKVEPSAKKSNKKRRLIEPPIKFEWNSTDTIVQSSDDYSSESDSKRMKLSGEFNSYNSDSSVLSMFLRCYSYYEMFEDRIDSFFFH